MDWDIVTAREHGIENEPHDEIVIAYAHSIGCVVISFDLYQGQTRQRVWNQLTTVGGKVIVVHGGTGQPTDEAVAKLLYHRPKWLPFLTREDGWVEIRDLTSGQTGCQLRRAANLQAVLQYSEVQQLQGYLRSIERARVRPRKVSRPPKTQPGQSVADFEGADLGGNLPGLLDG
jgi:hypothetical protein